MTDVTPSSHPRITDSEARARAAFEDVQVDHARADTELRDVLGDPSATPRTRMIASWGLGRLLHDAGSINNALATYEVAVSLADDLGDDDAAAQVKMSWALCCQAAGDVEGALAILDDAERHLHGAVLGRLLMQRGMVLMFLGRSDESAGELDRALPLLRTGDDRLAEARLLGSRGVVRIQLGDTDGARSDFLASQVLADELGQDLISAGALHNLGYLSGRLNEIPEALRLFSLAREHYARQGSPGRLMAALDSDECEVHLLAGLGHEALEVAGRVLADSETSGNAIQVAEAQLLVAKAYYLVGDRDRAAASADAAAEMFRTTSREPWEALATYLAVMARADDARVGTQAVVTEDVERLRTVAETLERLGWHAEASDVRVLMSRIAITQGRVEDARAHLALVATTRHRGTPTRRAEAWHATALLRLADGDRRGAKIAIGNGLRVIDSHRMTFGARELRARASVHGAALATLGLRIAIEGGRPADVLTASERWRAGALVGTAEPGAALASAELAELRRLDAELRQQLLSAPNDPSSSVAIARLRGAVDTLERAVTRATRMAPGDPRAVGARLDVAALRRMLAGRTLVEYLDVDQQLYAVVITATRSRLVSLGPTENVRASADHLMFALRLVVLHPGRPDAMSRLVTAAEDLDRLLFAPLELGHTVGGVVVVPPTAIQPIAWWSLPGARRLGEVTVAPSAAWWLAAAAPEISIDGTGMLLVAGPELEGADHEVATLAAMHPRSTVLAGTQATTRAVLEAMNGAGVVHIAAHGTFRADNPMFSALRLADGQLFVHDLESLVDAPQLVILTSCHAGRSRAYPGDELIGTATALLSVGVRAVIAPVLAVPDHATTAFAIDLHRRLLEGLTPSRALAATVEGALGAGSAVATMTAASFHCVAAGSIAGGGDVSAGAGGTL